MIGKFNKAVVSMMKETSKVLSKLMVLYAMAAVVGAGFLTGAFYVYFVLRVQDALN